MSIRVRVKPECKGYYEHQIRMEGQEFTIPNEQAFSSKWMEKVEDRRPGRGEEEAPKYTPALKNVKKPVSKSVI